MCRDTEGTGGVASWGELGHGGDDVLQSLLAE